MNTVNSTISVKGYVVLKSELPLHVQTTIRNDLMIAPYTPCQMQASGPQTKYPVYRESSKKMYLPYYYGVQKFGYPKTNQLRNNAPIHISFAGTLRPNQLEVANLFVRHVTDDLAKGTGISGGLLELPCAYGKTVLTLYIISVLKEKTMVIVHKEFLMNQWIERIEQFLPGAKVGKIQGATMDVEGKDIVLCMLQSLSMKEYPTALFEQFGFLVVDEVHHISSEVFSNALFKTVTKYQLGLSATMNRKDGTTNVFKMFLGEVLFKGQRDEERNVEVRAIEYQSMDEEFNETKTDYRGNVMYSSMIVKLCANMERSNLIVSVVQDLLKENSHQQIMILAHNKSILKYLHDEIVRLKVATVGYYLGGMKETALKTTENQQIVIATYAMAAEALDIKTLSTLIMATPKTDIQQSIGRILRDKHSQPIVVDIVDTHTVFKNQWNKRRQFYKKENYKICYASHSKYNANVGTNTSFWNVLFHPSSGDGKSKNGGGKKKNCIIDCEKDFESNFESDCEFEKEEEEKNVPTKCLLLQFK